MKKPMITVLMGVNNGEKYIKKTVESILNQTFENFEFIIVVNCSTDRTMDILNEIKDDRIRIFKTKIPQLGFNLNYGLNKSRAEYIARIDADDISDPDRLKNQLKILEEKNLDVIGSNVRLINEEGEFMGLKKYPETDKKIRKNIFLKSVIAHPTVLYKKSIIIKNGGYLGGRVSEDYNLWLRLMRDKNIKFYNAQEPLVDYRIHENQSKGNSIAYAEVAGHLITEAAIQRNILYFLGSIRYLITSMIKRKN